jgi:hypothetical protein
MTRQASDAHVRHSMHAPANNDNLIEMIKEKETKINELLDLKFSQKSTIDDLLRKQEVGEVQEKYKVDQIRMELTS